MNTTYYIVYSLLHHHKLGRVYGTIHSVQRNEQTAHEMAKWCREELGLDTCVSESTSVDQFTAHPSLCEVIWL